MSEANRHAQSRDFAFTSPDASGNGIKSWPSPDRRFVKQPIRALVATILLLCPLLVSPQASPAPKDRKAPPKKKITPEQELWCPVLDSAHAQTAAFEPAMRALLLRAIAKGLQKCDSSDVQPTLIAAFNATLEIPVHEEDLRAREDSFSQSAPDPSLRKMGIDLDVKQRLQEDSLRDLLLLNEAKVQELLPQAEPYVHSLILGSMLSRAIDAKNYDRAITLLNQIPAADFPYPSATDLMLKLPASRDADKQQIFLRALACDKESHSFIMGGDDFSAMIVRFWQHVPPAVALEGIHQVLDKAKSDTTHVGLQSNSGDISFDNEYEYRLFELLPVLEQLDKTEAENLLNDSQQAKSQLKQFPNGVQSLDPTIRDTPLKQGEAPHLNGAVGVEDMSSYLQTKQAAQAYETRANEIARQAQDNPKQALAAAASLPETVGSHFPRADALLGIARTTATKDPSIAKDALAQMMEILKKIDPSARPGAKDPSAYAIEGSDIAKHMGDLDLARKLIAAGLENAEKFKLSDEDPDDPNLALKAWWPSVVAISGLITASSQISPQAGLADAKGIDDPEVRVMCEVKMANKALGAHGFTATRMVSQKSKNWEVMSGSEE